MRELRVQANHEAEVSWARRKGVIAAYWRAVATYARHLAHALTRCPGAVPAEPDSELITLRVELKRARRQVLELIGAARSAVPVDEHPKEESPHHWAWQVRMLGQDWRAMREQLRQAEEELAGARCEVTTAHSVRDARDGPWDRRVRRSGAGDTGNRGRGGGRRQLRRDRTRLPAGVARRRCPGCLPSWIVRKRHDASAPKRQHTKARCRTNRR